jgi:cytochrome bd-type quinol oxidase subunit 1
MARSEFSVNSIRKGGEKVNKKISIISIILFAAAMLVSPVMGTGPINAADQNPNVGVETGIYMPFAVPWTKVELVLPSGVIYRRIFWPNSITSVLEKPADSFYCPTEIEFDETNFMTWLTNPDYIGKWVHMSAAGYATLFTVFGMTVPSIPPEGVYLLAIGV